MSDLPVSNSPFSEETIDFILQILQASDHSHPKGYMEPLLEQARTMKDDMTTDMQTIRNAINGVLTGSLGMKPISFRTLCDYEAYDIYNLVSRKLDRMQEDWRAKMSAGDRSTGRNVSER
jgi:hypothetical protein